MKQEDINKIVELLKAEQGKIQDNGNLSASVTFSQLMRDSNANFASIREDVAEIRDSVKEIRNNVQPAVDAIQASKTVGFFLKWTAGVVLSCTAIWVFTKEVIKMAFR